LREFEFLSKSVAVTVPYTIAHIKFSSVDATTRALDPTIIPPVGGARKKFPDVKNSISQYVGVLLRRLTSHVNT